MEIEKRYRQVIEKIDGACSRSHRDFNDVKLVVVTKGQPVEKILEVVNAGATLLGENYPEETHKKILELGEAVKPGWHMIGHIQSRKIKYLAQHFSVVHSLDNLDSAIKLDAAFKQAGRKIPVMMEINVSGERSKSGFICIDEYSESQLLLAVKEIVKLENLTLVGLMTMPPFQEIGSENRVYFSKCHLILERIREKLRLTDLNQLSMGTSFDLETAIEEGATYVRVGEAIMGPRMTKERK